MWAASATAALLAGLTVVSGYTVDVVVPEAPDYGSRVVLECNYRLDSGERIQHMSWAKDNEVFVTYRDGQSPVFTSIPGVNVNEANSTQRRVILTNVQDSASGLYGVQMSISSVSGGSTNVNTFTHNQEMIVGGEAADTLGNRFGGSRPQRRPVSSGTTVITSQSSSSSGSTGPIDGGLGNRFGGNRPAGASGGAAGGGFAATGGDVPLGAAPVPPPQNFAAQNAAANGLAQAQANLQNAVNELQNALNAALG